MAPTLAPASPAEKPAALVRRVLAGNPSPMTGPGTNTWLLGQGQVVLIDPGPDLPAHADAILAALQAGERITAILLTHGHADHVGLLPRLQDMTGAPSYGFGHPGTGRSAVMQALAAGGLPGGGEGFDLAYAPDHALTHGQVLTLGDQTLTALHTPGHTGCSMSFAWHDHLFTGDLAMGWSTSLVAPPDGDMGQYMASLRAVAETPWARLYPGHGDPVSDPAQRLAGLIQHRLDRESQIIAALSLGPATPAALTAQIYSDTPPALHAAAQRNVLAHLIDLVSKGKVAAAPQLSAHASFSLT